jgi:hypothetical protein
LLIAYYTSGILRTNNKAMATGNTPVIHYLCLIFKHFNSFYAAGIYTFITIFAVGL